MAEVGTWRVEGNINVYFLGGLRFFDHGVPFEGNQPLFVHIVHFRVLEHGAVGLAAFVLVLVGGERAKAGADTFADIFGDFGSVQLVTELFLDLVLETVVAILELPLDLPVTGFDLIQLESWRCMCCHHLSVQVTATSWLQTYRCCRLRPNPALDGYASWKLRRLNVYWKGSVY